MVRANECQLHTENISALLPTLTNLKALFLANNDIRNPDSWLEPLVKLTALDLFGNTEFADPNRVVCGLRNMIGTSISLRSVDGTLSMSGQRIDLGKTKALYCDEGDVEPAVDRSRCAPNCPWFVRGNGWCDQRSMDAEDPVGQYNLCDNSNCSLDHGDCGFGE